MVLAQVEGNTGLGQAATGVRVTRQRPRLVVMIGVDRLHTQLGGQCGDLFDRVAVPHDQPGAFHAV